MKRNLSGIGCACALALLSACATTEGSGDASSHTAVDYALYPTPDDAFVADVMPIENEGKLELYYLYETDHNIQAYHPIHKFSTEDFYQYEDLGLAGRAEPQKSQTSQSGREACSRRRTDFSTASTRGTTTASPRRGNRRNASFTL